MPRFRRNPGLRANPDRRTRELERRWIASGSFQDGAAYARALRRSDDWRAWEVFRSAWENDPGHSLLPPDWRARKGLEPGAERFYVDRWPEGWVVYDQAYDQSLSLDSQREAREVMRFVRDYAKEHGDVDLLAVPYTWDQQLHYNDLSRIWDYWDVEHQPPARGNPDEDLRSLERAAAAGDCDAVLRWASASQRVGRKIPRRTFVEAVYHTSRNAEGNLIPGSWEWDQAHRQLAMALARASRLIKGQGIFLEIPPETIDKWEYVETGSPPAQLGSPQHQNYYGDVKTTMFWEQFGKPSMGPRSEQHIFVRKGGLHYDGGLVGDTRVAIVLPTWARASGWPLTQRGNVRIYRLHGNRWFPVFESGELAPTGRLMSETQRNRWRIGFNPDERMRSLERAAQGGDLDAQAAFLRERMRAGKVDPAKLWLLARYPGAGERPAIERAFGEQIPLTAAMYSGMTWAGYHRLGGNSPDQGNHAFYQWLAHDIHVEKERGEEIPLHRLKTRLGAWAVLFEAVGDLFVRAGYEPALFEWPSHGRPSPACPQCGQPMQIEARDHWLSGEAWWVCGNHGDWITLPAHHDPFVDPDYIRTRLDDYPADPEVPAPQMYLSVSRGLTTELGRVVDIAYEGSMFAQVIEVPPRWIEEAQGAAAGHPEGILADPEVELAEIIASRWGQACGYPCQPMRVVEPGLLNRWVVTPERAIVAERIYSYLVAALLAWLRDEPPPTPIRVWPE
jgi:hypothetical protein